MLVGSTPAPAPAGSCLDPGALGDILELPNGHDLLGRLADCYRTSSLEELAALNAALGSGDRAAARRSAHRLRSSSGNVAALGLAGLCARLEELVQGEDAADAGDLLQEIEGEHARVLKALELELRRAA